MYMIKKKILKNLKNNQLKKEIHVYFIIGFTGDFFSEVVFIH